MGIKNLVSTYNKRLHSAPAIKPVPHFPQMVSTQGSCVLGDNQLSKLTRGKELERKQYPKTAEKKQDQAAQPQSLLKDRGAMGKHGNKYNERAGGSLQNNGSGFAEAPC